MVKLGVEIFFFKIPIGRTIFKFSFKTSGFCGAGWIFWSIFCQFFVIFWSKTWVFSGAGWSFWVKKTLFFLQNFSFCGAGCSFWVKKCKISRFFWDSYEKEAVVQKPGHSSLQCASIPKKEEKRKKKKKKK